MFRRVFLAAIAAGLLSGALITGIQAVTTTPLILEAEVYETGSGGGHDHGHGHDHDHGGVAAEHDHDHGQAVEDEGGFLGGDGGRLGLTLVANLVSGTGFALLLVACFALSGRPVDARTGVLWGLAGFAVFTLAPGLGLPPEVPGSVAADLVARQTWWVFAAAGAAAGLWLLVFGSRRWWAAPVGIALAVLPHVVGAPMPEGEGGGVAPPELAAHFAATAIVVNALFWAMLGWLSGNFYRRFG